MDIAWEEFNTISCVIASCKYINLNAWWKTVLTTVHIDAQSGSKKTDLRPYHLDSCMCYSKKQDSWLSPNPKLHCTLCLCNLILLLLGWEANWQSTWRSRVPPSRQVRYEKSHLEAMSMRNNHLEAISMWKNTPWGQFNMEKHTLRQFQLPMQTLEGLIRLTPPAPLNKDVGCHCLPHVLKHVCYSSLCKRNACCKHRVPCSTRNWTHEHVGCMQATTIQPQTRKLLHHVMNVKLDAWLGTRTVVNVIGTQTGMHHLETCCNQALENGSKWTASIHMKACYAQRICTYITNDMHHNPES